VPVMQGDDFRDARNASEFRARGKRQSLSRVSMPPACLGCCPDLRFDCRRESSSFTGRAHVERRMFVVLFDGKSGGPMNMVTLLPGQP